MEKEGNGFVLVAYVVSRSTLHVPALHVTFFAHAKFQHCEHSNYFVILQKVGPILQLAAEDNSYISSCSSSLTQACPGRKHIPTPLLSGLLNVSVAITHGRTWQSTMARLKVTTLVSEENNEQCFAAALSNSQLIVYTCCVYAFNVVYSTVQLACFVDKSLTCKNQISPLIRFLIVQVLDYWECIFLLLFADYAIS